MISRRTASVLAIALLILSACGPATGEDDAQQQHWQAVLGLKRSMGAVSSSANSAAHQMYADALQQFVKRYPAHGRAQQVYRSAELEFARQLCQLGHYREAVPYYQHLIGSAPPAVAAELRGELTTALERESVRPERIAAIKPKMSQAEVVAILGSPRPEWVTRVSKAGRQSICWYYPASGGGVAAVFFSGGRVYATDFPAPSRRM